MVGAVTELPLTLRPAAGEPQGALVLFHGRGVDERDLVPLLDVFDPDRRLVGLCPGGPITGIPPGGRHWYAVQRVGYPEPESFGSTYRLLGDLLEAKLGEIGVSWERSVLGGFSQGTVMAYALGLGAGRPRPGGIVALSGFIPRVQGWEPDLEDSRGVPVLIEHGAADQVIPVSFAREARDLLEDAGLDVTYLETPMPHAIDPRVLPEIAEWVGERTGLEV
jgi:phospholipase/carboxylesterase